MLYRVNDYYGHINKIQEYAIQHPEWFWSDAAKDHRQWLHDNGASSIIDTIYEETPDNLKPTDYKKLTKNQREKDIKDKIYQNQKEFINQAVETGFRSINLPGTVFDFYANQKSNGDYNTFGEMLRKGEDKGLWNIGYEFLNPGNDFDLIFSGTKLGTKAVKSVINSPRFKKALTNFRWNLGPKTWKQGDDAVKMFKTYGTQQPVEPHTSPLMEEIKKYVPEARERYGLVGNTNITDDEIAGSLYKKAMSLSKKDNAAVNEFGEPLLLFRGDTQRFRSLKPRIEPSKVVSGTMDNSLGNLFLGKHPYSFEGADRYLGTICDLFEPTLKPSGTGSDIVQGLKMSFHGEIPEGSRLLYSHPTKWGRQVSVYKLPAKYMKSGVNDLNAFVVNTKAVRDATPEISVLNDDFLLMGGKGTTLHGKPLDMSRNVSMDVGRMPRSSDARKAIVKHYDFVLKDAQQKGEGLLKSAKNSILREEHNQYDYYALPNFNINGAKSILPYDLNRSTSFIDKGFVYRKSGGKI